MITLYKFVLAICIIIQLAVIDHNLQENLKSIRLHNESKYPLTGTETEIEKVYPLTSSDSVNGYTLKATDQKQTVPLHNGEVKQ